MKKPLLGFVLALLLLYFPSTILADGYTNVTVEEAKTMIDSNPSLVILDVRTQSEYDSGHIRNAMLIPHTELEGRLDELETTDEILVYCRLGGRSSTASQILVNNGFLFLYNMLGGITAWKNVSYPVYVKYSSIQVAINNANEGDIIYVSSGTYYEHILVNKSVSFIGEDRNTTIVDGAGDTAITIEVNNVSLSHFTIQNGEYGALLYDASYNSIEHCTFEANWAGIYFNQSAWNRISDCMFLNNGLPGGRAGVVLYKSNVNLIENSKVINNRVGIDVDFVTSLISVTNCEISNSDWGIILRVGTNQNKIVNTNITSSRIIGLTLEYTGSSNKIFHNNFINNTQQLLIWDSTENSWDNGCEGNYWSNYNGSDLDGDGIGDEYLPWEGVDYYPLMSPYIQGDVNHDGWVDILDAITLANAFSSTPESPSWNPHCDLYEDGRIDILDAVVLADSFGKEWEQ